MHTNHTYATMALKARETYTPLAYPHRTDRFLAPGGYRNIDSSARKTWFLEFAVSDIITKSNRGYGHLARYLY